jgi:hypothetical protein
VAFAEYQQLALRVVDDPGRANGEGRNELSRDGLTKARLDTRRCGSTARTAGL